MGRSPSRQVTILPCWVVIGPVQVETMCFVCHVSSQDHVIKGSVDFIGGSSSLHDTYLPSLVALRIIVMELSIKINAKVIFVLYSLIMSQTIELVANFNNFWFGT